MKRDRLEYTLLVLLTVICAGALGIFGARYILPPLLPFIIAWSIAMLVRGVAAKLSHRLRIPERVVRVLCALLSVSVIFSLLFVGVWQGAHALWRLLVDMGEGGTYDAIIAFITTPFSTLSIAPELIVKLEEGLAGMLSSAFTFVADAIGDLAMVLPGALFFLLVTVIALIYFALDLERINAFVKGILPHRVSSFISRLRVGLIDVCKKYVRSYFLLMIITFAFMLIGLSVLGVEHAFIISVIIALLDVLPIIGVGTVLVPWSVFQLVLGDIGLGIGLAVLFVLHTVMRELLEPKIVGQSLNMHPILTLVLLYAGYSILGFFGLLLVPLVSLALSVLLDGRAADANQ